MTNYKEILRLVSSNNNYTQGEIASSCNCSRSTVQRTIYQFHHLSLSWDKIKDMTNDEIGRILYPSISNGGIQYYMPDFDHIVKERSKPGVTLQLCWLEYCESCQAANLHPYKYTQFAKYYHDHIQKTKATMHLEHKRGETMQVDWCGTTLSIKNPLNGKTSKVYIFTAVLPYSGYTYAEAFLNMKQESWISAHVNAYTYFGGATRILIPDNLKTGVSKNTRYETILNPTYQEMAEHYGTAIIPARPLSPKDKAAVEGTVGNITTSVLAPLRNRQYFSLIDINEDIFRLVNAYNNKPFQKKEESRASRFVEEKPFLLPLPAYPYELAVWKTAKVQFNYHVEVNGKYYSCPFEYIGMNVNIRISQKIVEIFYKGTRLISHMKLGDEDGEYSTVFEHMPRDHQKYSLWNSDKFRKWAETIGENTYNTVCYFLSSSLVEEQGYKNCMALVKFTEKYSEEQLETACQQCLQTTRKPTISVIKLYLEEHKNEKQVQNSCSYGIIRGPEYYMQKGDD